MRGSWVMFNSLILPPCLRARARENNKTIQKKGYEVPFGRKKKNKVGSEEALT